MGIWKIARAAAAAAALASASASVASATTYYVSTGGSDTANTGTTLGSSYATIAKAVSSAAAGDTILVRGGTYALSSTLSIGSSKAGTAAKPYTLANYNDEAVTLDFTAQAFGSSARGIQLNASYWTIRGLTVANAKDNGINIAGSYNTIDRCVTRNNQDTGVQISGTGAGNNLIRNVDSYANYDPATHGENADGFAAKFRGLGAGNAFDGCRAWGNSDDGWDMWAAENGVTIKNCWSFKNGYNTFGDTAWAGDGNGFKLGHDSGPHVLTNDVAWGNRLNGFDVNGNATVDTSVSSPYVAIAHGVTIENDTAWNNGDGANKTGVNYRFDEYVAQYPHTLRNDIALAGASGNATVVTGNVNDHNTWNSGFTVGTGDFLSLDDAIATGPRLADGSLPVSDFLRLKSTSALVDRGTNVGLAYNGAAPDLGAFVVPEPTTVGAIGAVALVAIRRRRK